jgi:hypothetical protein
VDPVCRARHRRRIRGIVLATLLVAAQTSAWVHAAAVAHATCLEHGETIHAGAAPSDGGEAASGLAAPVVSDGGPAASAHEHCAAGAVLRFRDVALAAPATIAFVPAARVPRLGDDSRATPAVAEVYRLAPKTSPPDAGV